MGRYLIFMHIYTRERVSKRRVLHKEEKKKAPNVRASFYPSLSSLSLVTQTKRKWKKHTHTHTHKKQKKTERKIILFMFKRTEGWLELFHKKWKGGFESVRVVRVRVNECACARVLFFL